MLKLILSLISNKASKKEWQLQFGAYFLKKGCGFILDEVLYEKKVVHAREKIVKVKVIKDLTYDFRTNKIHPTTVTRTVNANAIKKA